MNMVITGEIIRLDGGRRIGVVTYSLNFRVMLHIIVYYIIGYNKFRTFRAYLEFRDQY